MQILLYALALIALLAGIIIKLNLHNAVNFIQVFVFNPSAMMLLVGFIVSLPLLVFDRLLLVLVPMLKDSFKQSKNQIFEASPHLELILKTLRMNMITAGCLGVLFGLLGATHCSGKTWCAWIVPVRSVSLVYGLLLGLVLQFLLKRLKSHSGNQAMKTGYMETSEIIVLVPVLLIALGIMIVHLLNE